MPYVYADVRKIDGLPKVGDHECVALIRHFAKAPATAVWRQGDTVLGNKSLRPGTAIATFVKGRWPALKKGNHSAFYVGQVSNGIYVIDQWRGPDKKFISKRFIYVKKIYADGTFETPSDNAATFSVIE